MYSRLGCGLAYPDGLSLPAIHPVCYVCSRKRGAQLALTRERSDIGIATGRGSLCQYGGFQDQTHYDRDADTQILSYLSGLSHHPLGMPGALAGY